MGVSVSSPHQPTKKKDIAKQAKLNDSNKCPALAHAPDASFIGVQHATSHYQQQQTARTTVKERVIRLGCKRVGGGLRRVLSFSAHRVRDLSPAYIGTSSSFYPTIQLYCGRPHNVCAGIRSSL